MSAKLHKKRLDTAAGKPFNLTNPCFHCVKALAEGEELGTGHIDCRFIGEDRLKPTEGEEGEAGIPYDKCLSCMSRAGKNCYQVG